jgi:hypothetical protein
LLHAAEAHARRVLVGSEAEMMPLFDPRDPARQCDIGPFFGEDAERAERCKDIVADAVRESTQKHKIVGSSFVSEAVVIAIAIDCVGYKMRRWRINRDGARCVDLVLDSEDDEMPTPKGRFDNLPTPVAH